MLPYLELSLGLIREWQYTRSCINDSTGVWQKMQRINDGDGRNSMFVTSSISILLSAIRSQSLNDEHIFYVTHYDDQYITHLNDYVHSSCFVVFLFCKVVTYLNCTTQNCFLDSGSIVRIFMGYYVIDIIAVIHAIITINRGIGNSGIALILKYLVDYMIIGIINWYENIITIISHHLMVIHHRQTQCLLHKAGR